MTIHCQHCGFDNPPGMRFCGNCGARLTVEIQETQQNFPTPHIIDQPKNIQNPLVNPESLGILTGYDLLERFRKAGLEANGQRRSVTVLFVDLSDYTHLSEELPDEELFELVQKFIRLLVNNVYKYEGMVDKLTGDGLMALFGAPIAHENNAERAIRSALDMVSDVANLSRELDLHGRDLSIHIGINTGSVIVGGLGGNGLMNYTAIGDSVNMARRLEENAPPGHILVSEVVHRQTHRLFNFESLPPLWLKNVSHGVTAFRVISAKTKAVSMRGIEGLFAPMIGREEEYSRITHMVDQLASKKVGGVILVVGEGGMGKSRLTSEVKSAISLDQLMVIEGQSLTYRKSIAYWIFQDMLRNYLGISPDSSSSFVQKKLVETVLKVLGEGGRSKLPYLEHLFSLQPSDQTARERIQFLDPGQLRQQVFLALRDLLVGISQIKPLLIILEDLHWADDASLELIRFLVDSTKSSPIIIYAITRPFDSGVVKSFHERAQQRLADQYLYLHLQALQPDQSEKLLMALLSIQDFPIELRQKIIERAAGLPFYLEEMLRMLIERNIIVRNNDCWQFTTENDLDIFGVPETLQGLILARFDRLTLAQRRVLETASVIGYRFSSQLLTRVLSEDKSEFNPGEVRKALLALQERDFINSQFGMDSDFGEKAQEIEVYFQFKHVLVSDAVYSTLLHKARQALHTRVGEEIEILYADRLEEHTEVLASHYLRSPYLDRALRYLLLAGQKAALSYANEQAQQLFHQSLELLPKVNHTSEQALIAYTGLGDALQIAGDYSGAREQYINALDSLGIPGKTGALRTLPAITGVLRIGQTEFMSLLSQLQRKISKTLESQGDYDKALIYLQSAQMVLQDNYGEYDVELANCLNDTGWIYFRRGLLDQAEKLLLNGLKIIEPSGNLNVTASILNRLAGVYFQRDSIEQASSYMKRSLQIREEIGDVGAVARSYNNLGLINWKQGLLQEALEDFHRSFSLQINLGDVEGQIVLQTNMGLIEMDCGNLIEADRYFHEALDNSRQIGHSYHVCMTQMHLALLNVYAENWPAVLDYAQLSLAGFHELGVKENLLDLFVSLGWAYIGLSDEPNSQEIHQRILAILEESENPVSSPPEGQGRAYRLLAKLANLRGDKSEAKRGIERSIEIFTQSGSLLERGRSLVEMGKLLASEGLTDQARDLLKESKRVFEMMGAKLELMKLKQVESDI